MLAARYRLPAVHPYRFYLTSGDLMSYGIDYADVFRRAASYVDRILRGKKPGELPVQAPTEFELVINVKTAKALGLSVPPTLLARADEVIEWGAASSSRCWAAQWPCGGSRRGRGSWQSRRGRFHNRIAAVGRLHTTPHPGGWLEQENGHGALHGPVRVHARSVDGIYEASRGSDGYRQGAGTEARMPV